MAKYYLPIPHENTVTDIFLTKFATKARKKHNILGFFACQTSKSNAIKLKFPQFVEDKTENIMAKHRLPILDGKEVRHNFLTELASKAKKKHNILCLFLLTEGLKAKKKHNVLGFFACQTSKSNAVKLKFCKFVEDKTANIMAIYHLPIPDRKKRS